MGQAKDPHGWGGTSVETRKAQPQFIRSWALIAPGGAKSAGGSPPARAAISRSSRSRPCLPACLPACLPPPAARAPPAGARIMCSCQLLPSSRLLPTVCPPLPIATRPSATAARAARRRIRVWKSPFWASSPHGRCNSLSSNGRPPLPIYGKDAKETSWLDGFATAGSQRRRLHPAAPTVPSHPRRAGSWRGSRTRGRRVSC